MDTTLSHLFPHATPRKGQWQAVTAIIEQFKERDIVVCQFPTGSGKSAIAMTLARYYKQIGLGNSILLTSSKMLQNQYIGDFPEIKDLKGEDNYSCDLNNKVTSLGVCKFKNQFCACPYKTAKKAFLQGPISCTNYACFATLYKTSEAMMDSAPELKEVAALNNFQLLICDEAHNIESQVTGIFKVSIENKELYKLFDQKLNLPDYPAGSTEWKTWLANDLLEFLVSARNDKASFAEKAEVVAMDRYISSIKVLLELWNNGVEVASDPTNVGIEFAPINIRSMISNILTKYNVKLLLMSGTITDHESFMSSVGLEEHDYGYLDMPSNFPVVNRPINLIQSIGNLNFSNIDSKNDEIAELVRSILDKHQGQRGLILTSSYKMAEDLKYKIGKDYEWRLIVPARVEKEMMIESTLGNSLTSDAVLVSPSLWEGINLKDDLGRFCIIIKAPFGGLGSDYDKKRFGFDPRGYEVDTIRKILQGTGRIIRSSTDYGVCYLLDGNIERIIRKNISVLPKWWTSSLKVQK